MEDDMKDSPEPLVAEIWENTHAITALRSHRDSATDASIPDLQVPENPRSNGISPATAQGKSPAAEARADVEADIKRIRDLAPVNLAECHREMWNFNSRYVSWQKIEENRKNRNQEVGLLALMSSDRPISPKRVGIQRIRSQRQCDCRTYK